MVTVKKDNDQFEHNLSEYCLKDITVDDVRRANRLNSKSSEASELEDAVLFLSIVIGFISIAALLTGKKELGETVKSKIRRKSKSRTKLVDFMDYPEFDSKAINKAWAASKTYGNKKV